jgi:hypothetical protein
MPITYENSVLPYMERFNVIDLSPQKQNQVATFLRELYRDYLITRNIQQSEKPEMWAYMKLKLAGEAALEQHMGSEFIQYQPDQYGLYRSKGIDNNAIYTKVFSMDEFPVIYQRNTAPMVFIMHLTKAQFLICGAAGPQKLNSFQDVSLVPPSIENRANRTGFYGFDELRQFTDINSLRALFRR